MKKILFLVLFLPPLHFTSFDIDYFEKNFWDATTTNAMAHKYDVSLIRGYVRRCLAKRDILPRRHRVLYYSCRRKDLDIRQTPR